MERKVFRRPDYWRCYQWQLRDGTRFANILFFPNSTFKWCNGNAQPISDTEVRKFFKWWRQGRFDK